MQRLAVLCVLLLWPAVGSADPPADQPDATNLALHRPATQSSVYGGTGVATVAANGVDGVIAPDNDLQSLFHTNLEDQPWWQVDLGAVVAIGEVHLHNRVLDAAPDVAARARTAQVLLSDDGKQWRRVYQHDGTTFAVLRLALKDARGRHVRVQLGERTYLHMYEVEVYGPADRGADPHPVNPGNAPLPSGTGTTPPPVATTDGGKWFTHPNGTYRFRVPAGWQESRSSDDSALLLTPSQTGQESIIVAAQGVTYSGALEDAQRIAEEVELDGLREPRQAMRMTLGGAPALLVWGRSRTSEKMLWNLDVFDRGTIHSLIVCGPPDSKRTAALDLVLSSYELLGGVGTLPTTASPDTGDASPDEDLSLPSGLDPLPPESEAPPAPAANPLPPVPAGKRLAQTVVGPAGGKVEAPGAVTMVFPPGALAAKETITVTTGEAIAGARLYDITRTGTGLMTKPVQLSFPVPAGLKPDDVLALHQLAPGVYGAPRFRYDPEAGLLTTEVKHFSAVGWLSVLAVVGGLYVTGTGDRLVAPLTPYLTAEQAMKLLSALVGALSGGYTANAVGLVVVGVPGLGIVVGVAGGAYAGSRILTAAHEAYLRKGLAGPLPVGRFNVYWPENAWPAQPAVMAILGNQELYNLLGPDVLAPETITGVPFGAPDPLASLLRPKAVRLPVNVLMVMERLQYAERWYELHQMPVPAGPTDVVIRPWEGTVVGETYNGAIHLNANLLAGEGATDGRVEATIAHELFHLICASQGWTERRFVGSEDSVCVAMETQVFPHVTAFREYAWPLVFPTLRNGLVRQGPGEEANIPARRGYYLWPWTHYLAYSYGVSALREYVTDTIPDDALAQRFRNFCYSVIAADRALRDPLTVAGVRASTGWALGNRDLDRMAEATMGSRTATLPLGASDLRASSPLSLSLLVLNVPRSPGGTLVIRRDWPEETEEYVAIRPSTARENERLPSGRTTADMRSMKGGMALRGAWVDSPTFKTYLPVAVICTATGQQGAPQTDARLIAYRLNPPTGVTMTKQPGQPTRLSWKLPETGCTLPLNDCLSSYRVFGKTKNNTDQLIAELYFDIPQADLKQFEGKAMLSITPGQTEVMFPAAATEQYIAMGMQSVEKALKYPSGKQVMSDIAWSPYACSISISPNPFEVTVGRQMVFDAKADYPPKGARYVWSCSGQVVRNYEASAPMQFATEGPASVTVTLMSEDGKTLCSATASGRVKKKELPPEQPDVQEPAKDEATAHGVWRLARREVESSQQERPWHEIAISDGSTDARNYNRLVGEPDRRMLYHCLHSWSAPPTTIVPGREYSMRITAQSVAFPEGEGARTTTVFGAGSFLTEEGVSTDGGSTEPAAAQLKFQAYQGAPGATWRLWVGGAGGWMRWRVDYVYEWVP